MPISSEVDHERRLIRHSLTDPLVFEDLCASIDRQWADQVWAYAVLYDARALAAAVPMGELRQLSGYIESVGLGQTRGPVGVFIAARAEMLRSGMAYASGTGRARDLEILLNQGQMDAWLDRHTIRR
jgi:hypothetical protein